MEGAINENSQTGKKRKHPKGLFLLFITEMWERYSYYGMRSILVLYLTAELISGGLGMDKESALMLYGLYTGLVYFTPLIGGYLTDRLMGLRTAITIGGITMAAGDFTLFAVQEQWGLYLGLLLLIIGNGFFKPNISTLVGELYDKNDPRKDSAFTIFYMGINLGALISPLVAGLIYATWFHDTTANGIEVFGFKYAFLASSIGMIIGQVTFNSLSKKYLGDVGVKPAATMATPEDRKNAAPLTKHEKHRTAVILILACFTVMFWAGFEQAGASFTLYTRDFVDRTVFGYEIPVSFFQSLNPLFILLLAPVVSALWYKLSRTKRGDFSIPTKMSFGLILLGLGFMVMVPAVMITGSDESAAVQVSMLFMIVTYLLHTLGELSLSPIGLSLVSKMSPVKIASLLMGVWFLSNAAANYMAGYIASLTTEFGYLEIFTYLGIAAFALGLVLLALSKPLQKLMHVDEIDNSSRV
ncbi:peptide MFS transporter [Alkalihalobacillus sp. AL-G]|uniref:peptide MFS transporter n=1 Tax=Alkalihalobacillus sp. AL-G TaxID=2926399 RepID=UPI00272CB07C|nr:peptide MFS transporter [Alkalihalobacillus sp. AL-G]WLD91604.1 peptide MFS transporter [Alkalihalobacillus sp. AL-G]